MPSNHTEHNHRFNIRAMNVAAILLITFMVGWLLIIGRDLIIPFILALMIWYVLDTIASKLQSVLHGTIDIPYWIALSGAFLVAFLCAMLIINLVAQNATDLAQQSEEYSKNIETKLSSFLGMIAPTNDFKLDKFSELVNLQKLVGWTTSLVSNLVGMLVLIIIYLLFIFLEQSVFEKKFSALFSTEEKQIRAHKIRVEIMDRIRTYLSVKTFTSLTTGVLSFLLLTLIGVDYAAFWGFIIFMLNYIPTIGSMLGVLFPAALALVQFDTSWQFFAVLALLGVVQFAIGNILEPKLMGSSLNLSGLVIMLALAVWGAIWGITGMILSVPITVVILIICAQFESSRPIAVLLSSNGKV